jgi:hypothetical protein
MPSHHFVERHETLVHAPAGRVYDALLRTDLASRPLVRALLAVRTLPARLARTGSGRGERSRDAPLDLKALLGRGFVLLEARPPSELVLGLTGRFWKPAGGILVTDPTTFRELPPPGTARVAWSFTVSEAAAGRTRLATETRIRCADAAARRAFRLYWWLIRPGSGLIRRAILSSVRRAAEARRVAAS